MSFEEWCTQKSFENMVDFYKDELIEIAKGNLEVVNEGKRRNLRNHGILVVVYNQHKTTVLSKKARDLLEHLLEEEGE